MAGIKRMPRQEKAAEEVAKALGEIWGEKLGDPATRELVKKTVIVSGLPWHDEEDEPQPGTSRQADDSDDSDSAAEDSPDSDEDEEGGTLRQRKTEAGLFKHVADDHVVLEEFHAALKKETTSTDAIKKTLDRLSLFLGYVEDTTPDKTGYMALVQVKAAKDYIRANLQVRTKSTTIVIYAKAVLKCLQLMTKRPKKMPSVPWNTPGFKELYEQSKAEWADIQKKHGRKAVKARNDRLAKGHEVIASIPACYAYISSETERTRMKNSLEQIKTFARSKTHLTFGRGDVAAVIAYNYVVRFLMMSMSIRNGGPRTGVLQNFRLSELENANVEGEHVVVRVARHKTGQNGNASLVLTNEEFQWLQEFVDVRRRIRSQDKEDRQRVFVTTGGLMYRTQTQDINTWMKRNNYPAITTNSIRRAIETAASNHSGDVQRTVAKHLHHSVDTADKNYRATTSEGVLRDFHIVANVINNQRALTKITQEMETLFVGMDDFPPIEEVQAALRRELQEQSLELSEATYKSAKQAFVKWRKGLGEV